MSDEIQIRALQEQDAGALLDLMIRLSRETPYTLLSEAENQQTTQLQQARTAELVHAPTQQVYVATGHDTLVGFIAVSRGVFSKIRHVATLVMGVQQAYWGSGVADKLIQPALAWADKEGVTRIELTTASDNQRALRFYRRHGFVQEGVKRSSLKQADGLRDEILMARVRDVA